MPKYSIQTIPYDTAAGDWNELLSNSVNVSPFHHLEWLNAYSKAKGESFEIIGCYNENNEIVAGFAYFYRKKYGYKLIINLLGIDNHIIYRERATKLQSKKESYYFDIYEAINNYLDKNCNHIEYTLSYCHTDIRPFKWQGFKSEIRYTYIGDLTDTDTLLKNFNPDVRNKIKKALKLNYRFDCSNSAEEILVSHQLIKRSLDKNSQAQVLDQEEYQTFCKLLHQAEMIKVCNIYNDETPVATRVIIHNKNQAIDFQAGGNEAYFKTGLNQLLSYKIFEMLHQNNIGQYDFRGANTPTIARYKSGFNFNLKPYYHIWKDKGLMFKAMLKTKELIANVR
ncbi:GNAT family N-acetyltransferase [Carboxylicivirga sp. RSCT41]|uniref:GNAT family N-acetyltransferase n=1 Tax=Carboxylicivirga agarovorans TaxID=3417570 RepID=UPI003D33559E